MFIMRLKKEYDLEFGFAKGKNLCSMFENFDTILEKGEDNQK